MTPEERAREIVYSYELDVLRLRQSTIDWLAEQIVAAIRAAVEAERERCAALVRAKAGPWGGVGLLTDFVDLADEIKSAS